MDSIIQKYLEDAIAAEKSFEKQLTGFADEASLPQARELFEIHAGETRLQYESLTARLEALGGSLSTAKTFLANLFNMSPKMAQLGHQPEERTTQDLIMAYAVENAEVAMYEALSIAAETAGDSETAALARGIQAEERATAEKVWPLIAASAHGGLTAAKATEGAAQGILRYLQDAEAAERNFEDALATFSKAGHRQQRRNPSWP